MTKENLILLADAYKYSHHKLYIPGTQYIYSYLESRGGKFDETVFYGLQYFLKEYLEGAVFTKEKLDEAEQTLNEVFGRTDVFDRSKFEYIIDHYGGKLPVRIKAVPEGTVVPVKNVLMTIENTDPECYWLTNFLETLLMQVWYPCTVATVSREIKKIVYKYYTETASESAFAGIDFVLNDFGFRGASSVESAGIGGSAHLVNFSGSDTIAGSVFAKKFYNAATAPGLSIPATEHSICTLLGEAGELTIFKHVLDTFPTGTIACVSDSYNIFRACEEYWGTELKEQILNRKGTLVIRPDSGDPVQTLTRVLDILTNKFGYTVNEKGYKVLPPQVRVIQGDGISYSSIPGIYEGLKKAGFSAENLVLGMGGALLQRVNRDTQEFALKCSYAVVNGKGIDVQKMPVELDANGNLRTSFKKSKAGKLKLVNVADKFQTVGVGEEPGASDLLQTVFENGQTVATYSFDEVRRNARI
ncbi:nicotinamide phosphoribosyltransferase [Chitinophaga terrae (ex Kim and Jung 2007)]|uniref:Nicotinamide phosphoribosyltransferase n=1 Tax=Chitinophaga terrae (ex Kim and Jung 2007) TaxID=408074 RepID=A0A1H4G472_9BACT|nr:nicotinate phosphoribosyltransferase [Chitinophaga terrae (ex Kim and Jung 2007)]MDQ0109878.1 nicotinamide phosphoribosyltransferase [Chitinophaga terrae (ex Kim and Jung 2007)]GEP92972.1 nicotinate phosphoribosyltransferase [Chitinophaga terrae (ex Kim and Jung 2007)]SEB04344.1 nicotinamide phosphoribosyltransferase [Chitinophaga terrae (ex Kim and Jung 2007)]